MGPHPFLAPGAHSWTRPPISVDMPPAAMSVGSPASSAEQYRVPMRDMDVRAALHANLAVDHADELDETLVVDELGLCGEVRVDVAVINGALTGFELKSARDTLRRLPKQIAVYSQVLDYAELVVAENHLEAAAEILPAWWGIRVAVCSRADVVHVERTREPRRNLNVEPYSLAQLLWRDEALDELSLRSADRGVRSKPRSAVWRRLTETVATEELRDVVRNRLKVRSGWRAGALSAPGAGGPPIAAMSSGCRN
ncbi:exonuclease [Gordonia phage Powerball]|uniref:Exonuclease n=1 Tax=Gordonia phage Powerball TaxID=2599847 RepID=A0A5J6TUD7_9CAUD|nr:exonuclease [Gordonia phage Powerball]QFG13509.1 exonuclease [Gordonia phage Powerball]